MTYMSNNDGCGKIIKEGGRATSKDGDQVEDCKGCSAAGHEGADLLVKGKTKHWS
jgi:hypothetical protein